jgi:hypothetical protein
VAGPATGPGAAIAAISGQQPFQQAGAEFGHRGADGQLGRLQSRPAGGQRPRRQGRQALYLGGGFRLERLAEPPFSPDGSSRGSRAGPAAGLASQIASLTSTICSLTARNSL